LGVKSFDTTQQNTSHADYLTERTGKYPGHKAQWRDRQPHAENGLFQRNIAPNWSMPHIKPGKYVPDQRTLHPESTLS